jgi:hypothetical protein
VIKQNDISVLLPFFWDEKCPFHLNPLRSNQRKEKERVFGHPHTIWRQLVQDNKRGMLKIIFKSNLDLTEIEKEKKSWAYYLV